MIEIILYAAAYLAVFFALVYASERWGPPDLRHAEALWFAWPLIVPLLLFIWLITAVANAGRKARKAR